VGPGAPEPQEVAEEFVLLRQALCATLSGEWLTVLCPRGSAGKPPEPWWLGAYRLVPGPWLVPEAGREPRIGSGHPSIGSLVLGRAPEP
jgi:hypothetical protein